MELVYLLWILTVSCVFLIPILFGWIYSWSQVIIFSIFGIHTLIHLCLQIAFSIKNRRATKCLIRPSKIAVQIVGWKENKEYYNYAIESIKQNAKDVDMVLCVIDGNQDSDLYMINIARSKLNCNCVFLEKRFSEMTEDECNKIVNDMGSSKYYCIVQPHKNKREAMYTSISILIKLGFDYVLFMDSDTLLMPQAINHLMSRMDSNVGAVTGDVRIFNIQNLLSFICYLKYWTSFNFERASQSHHNSVSCVSGPLGLYNIDALAKIVEDWRTQTFMGEECTYGDDRHLTNLLLKSGYKVRYDHRAIAYTETPLEFQRFFFQQIRWGKSFIREFLLNIAWFPNNPLWMAYDLSFQFLYRPLFATFAIILLIDASATSISYLYSSVIFVSLFKGIVAALIERKWYMTYFSFYGIIYMYVMVPIGLASLITLKENGWGTGNRLQPTTKRKLYSSALSYFVTIMWVSVILWRSIVGFINVANELDYSLHTILLFTSMGILFIQSIFYKYAVKTIRGNIDADICKIVGVPHEECTIDV
jgi:hyaluronan synthase